MISNGIVFEAIVSISCGSRKGTAFFVEPNRLLTARHVVLDALRNNAPVNVACKDAIRVCSKVEAFGTENEKSELTVLTIDNYTHGTTIPLLALPSKIDKKLFVAGYPLEIGNNRDLFDFEIHHTHPVTDNEYDMVASLKELIPFTSYRGFSGSPVITDEGFAVGVITDKLARVVGYSSVIHWCAQLESCNLIVSNNWEDYDDSTYGYGRSVALVHEAVKKAGDRYSPDMHVKNDALEEDLNIFCNKSEIARKNSIYPSVEDWYLRIRSKYSFIKDDYKPSDYASLAPCLRKFRDDYKEREKDPDLLEYQKVDKEDIDELKHQLNKLNEIFNSSPDILKFKCAFIHGIAGSGKTHSLCRFAETHEVKCQPYLLYGGQFVSNETFLQQVEELLGFSDGLKGLDNYMSDKNRYAVVIVDAINEGVGLAYWNDILVRLPQEVEKYKNIRFIFSARVPDNSNLKIGSHNKWVLRYIDGFGNYEEAIEKYFDKYGVDKEYKNNPFYEFYNPLFLRIFCIAYSRIPYNKKKSITKLELFLNYLQVRNKDVTNIIDEDLYLDVTTDYLLKLAEFSLDKSNDGEITRAVARDISYDKYPNKSWRYSLLYACLQETLLLESYGKDRYTPCVEFEFENLGDFLKVAAFLKKGIKGKAVTNYLTVKKKQARVYGPGSNRFVQFVGALLSVENDNIKEFYEKALSGKEWDNMLFDTLQYKGPLRQRIITKFIKDGNGKLLAAMIRNADAYSFVEVKTLHDELMQMNLPERDLKWSVHVNGLYDWNGRQQFIDFPLVSQPTDKSEDDLKKVTILMVWMLTSSYPELRAILVRHITNLLTNKPKLANFSIEFFKSCNDPYVLQGLYCAIYGVTLRLRNADIVGSIAELVYNSNYAEGVNVPKNWLIRYWTMKILERAANLDSDYNYWNKVKPPFITGDNPYSLIDESTVIDDNYFGESKGSRQLYYSLFGMSDFNRYIIGTNTSKTDRILVNKDTHDAVLLDDIAKMIGARIKELGWNDELGHLDDEKYSNSRFENKTERLGKKYQWIAYYDIMGRLTDYCSLRKEKYGYGKDKTQEVNYPWYADIRDYFDPTLQPVTNDSVGISFDKKREKLALGITANQWINDNNNIPPLNLLFKDNKGGEWIYISGFTSEEQEDCGDVIRYATNVNSAFVRQDDANKIEDWSKHKNFYGRWMPERREAIDFRWNEYPWADSFVNSLEDDEWERPSGQCPSDIMVSYMVQLQEDTIGFDSSENFSSIVYMPCVDMMKKLNLYTGERGIVRQAIDDSIVGVDFRLTGGDNTGLLLSKSTLDLYLSMTGYTLFFFVLAEKTLSYAPMSSIMKDISGCWKYDREKGLTVVQLLNVTASHPE